MPNLWNRNTPQNFWHCLEDTPDALWDEAIRASLPVLNLPQQPGSLEEALALVLGEEQFGKDHWNIDQGKRFYYHLKPILPRWATRFMRQKFTRLHARSSPLGFPIEDRYTSFLRAVMLRMLQLLGKTRLPFIHFWKHGRSSAFVLTHDIETAKGQAFAHRVADLEEKLGFRSVFNFVLDRYPLDEGLQHDLAGRGFEIGVHGLKHDGKLFFSQSIFKERARLINGYIRRHSLAGFRAPLTHRNPHWMQELELQYDLSFFDSDPYEPIPGGSMSIYPFSIGKFIELPYTLMQDFTYFNLLCINHAGPWMEKVTYLQQHNGMILLNTHPDYLEDRRLFTLYVDFLLRMREIEDTFWHALPRDVAAWWRARMESASLANLPGAVAGQVELQGDALVITGGRLTAKNQESPP